jgi:hypothetical protein
MSTTKKKKRTKGSIALHLRYFANNCIFIVRSVFFCSFSDRRYVYNSLRVENHKGLELAEADRQRRRVSAHCEGAHHAQGVGHDEARRRQRQARNRVERHDRLHDALRSQERQDVGSQGCILHALRGSPRAYSFLLHRVSSNLRTKLTLFLLSLCGFFLLYDFVVFFSSIVKIRRRSLPHCDEMASFLFSRVRM